MRIVALYARVSTTDQSCDVQLAELRRYAEQRFGVIREYIDVGISGAQRHRPNLDALMADARKRRFDAVLVWKFDRFARSLSHLIDSLEEFAALGIDFVSYTENFDTTTPSGRLLFHIVGAFAQFERDLIGERVRAGIAHAKAMGKRIGRPPAEIDGEQVHQLRNQNLSLRKIAKVLNVPISRVRRALNKQLAAPLEPL
jgi:DNA invertase Pin-like site-specific DNA recombinase